MIDRIKLNLLIQLVSAMEDAFAHLEKAYKNKNAENLEKSKKTFLEFQEKLSQELK